MRTAKLDPSPPSAPADSLPTSDGEDLSGTVLAGRFRLERRLGAGGMGAVYQARAQTGEGFAIKLIHADVAAHMEGALERFVQEARTSGALQNPHVVSVLDAGIDPALRTPFLVMPLLSGFDVESLIERAGPLDPTTAVRIALQAARGLAAAHAARVVHRDVKPANLFLHHERGRVVVKTCDFGIAKSLLDRGIELTRTGTVMGSPPYMSPEQAKSSRKVDARADVWSLGASLYHMLAGKYPHDEIESLAELLVAICTRDAPPVQDRAPWIEPGLARVVHGTLIRDLDARCPSMEELGRALFGFAGGSDELSPEMLAGVPPRVRSTTAPRAELPKRWEAPLPTEAGGTATGARSEEVDAMIGQTLAGRYRLEKVLGRGGMGAVYQAVTPAGERFAIKVVLSHLEGLAETNKRFVREARASIDIRSPHVVRVFEADADPATGVPFIVMELLSGTDLQQLVRRVGPLEPVVVAKLFHQVCQGLGAAHARSIIHRDVKPANIFLHVTPAGEVEAKVCDFGIAKSTTADALDQTSNQLTKTGGMLGSPVYMSPEQAKNAKHVDPRTDVWSVCLSMYEALTGSEPWAHCTTLGELILAICTEELPPLAQVAPWAPPALVQVVERGLRRSPNERWPSMAELCAALEPLLGGSPCVTGDMLVGVPHARREAAAQRLSFANAPTIQSSSVAGMTQTAVAAPRPAKRGLRNVSMALAGLVLAGGLAAVFVQRRGVEQAPSVVAEPSAVAPAATATSLATVASEAAPTPSAPEPASPQKVRVPIIPANAKVLVNGQPGDVEEGALVLRGEPGDRFQVVAIAGAARLETAVTILKDGATEPSSIAVIRPAAGRPPTIPVSPRTSAPSVKPPAAPAAPPAAPAAPRLQNDW